MKSTLFNMVAVLFTITLVASAGVGGVNMITAEAIAEAKQLAVTQAVKNVLPEFAESSVTELAVDEIPVKVYTATSGDEVKGYAVETMTKIGFGGAIRMMVGSKMCDEGNALITSVQGKNPADMKLRVKKDGGDVDALTAATISSRAYVDAVARAYEAFAAVSGKNGVVDGVSGATAENKEGGKDE